MASTFAYTALDASGIPQKGELAGESRQSITEELRRLIQSGLAPAGIAD